MSCGPGPAGPRADRTARVLRRRPLREAPSLAFARGGFACGFETEYQSAWVSMRRHRARTRNRRLPEARKRCASRLSRALIPWRNPLPCDPPILILPGCRSRSIKVRSGGTGSPLHALDGHAYSPELIRVSVRSRSSKWSRSAFGSCLKESSTRITGSSGWPLELCCNAEITCKRSCGATVNQWTPQLIFPTRGLLGTYMSALCADGGLMNWEFSVEPSSASVSDLPPATIICTASK